MAESRHAEATKHPAPERVERTREPAGEEPAVQVQCAVAPTFHDRRIDPRRLTPQAILALQRTVGNAAVNQLLRKQAADEALLSEAQMQAALRWGANGDHIGTEAITALQTALHLPDPSGVYDRDTVEKVAQWQHANHEVMDGEAGPRTFARLGLILTKQINAATLSSDEIFTDLEKQGGVTIAVYAAYQGPPGSKLQKQAGFFKDIANKHAQRFGALGLGGNAIRKGVAMPVSGAAEVIEKVQSVERGLAGRYREEHPTAKDIPAYLRVRNLAIFSHGLKHGMGLDTHNTFQAAQGGLSETNVEAFAKGLEGALASDVRVQLFACSTAGDAAHGDSLAAHLAQDLGKDASVYGHEVAGHATGNPFARVLGKDAGGAGAEGLDLFDLMFPDAYRTAELARLFPDDDKREARRTQLVKQMRTCYEDFIRSSKEGTTDMGEQMFTDPDHARQLFHEQWQSKWVTLPKHLHAITPTQPSSR